MAEAPTIKLQAGGKWLGFPCQGDCTKQCLIPIAPQRGAKGQSWRISSVDGAPISVEPSIDCSECGFHGHIQDGEIIATCSPGRPELYEAHMRRAFGEED